MVLQVQTCSLEEIFGCREGRSGAYAKRTSSARWDLDTLTLVPPAPAPFHLSSLSVLSATCPALTTLPLRALCLRVYVSTWVCRCRWRSARTASRWAMPAWPLRPPAKNEEAAAACKHHSVRRMVVASFDGR